MKTLPSILLASAIAFTGAAGTAALADSKSDKGKNTKSWTERIFKKLDTNKDGVISKDEYAKRGIKRFAKTDKDGNGKVTAAEYETAAVERAKKRAQRRFKKLDTNNNGVLDVTESNARYGKRFARIDTNHDGKISRAEIEKSKKKFHRARYRKSGTTPDKTSK